MFNTRLKIKYISYIEHPTASLFMNKLFQKIIVEIFQFFDQILKSQLKIDKTDFFLTSVLRLVKSIFRCWIWSFRVSISCCHVNRSSLNARIIQRLIDKFWSIFINNFNFFLLNQYSASSITSLKFESKKSKLMFQNFYICMRKCVRHRRSIFSFVMWPASSWLLNDENHLHHSHGSNTSQKIQKNENDC